MITVVTSEFYSGMRIPAIGPVNMLVYPNHKLSLCKLHFTSALDHWFRAGQVNSIQFNGNRRPQFGQRLQAECNIVNHFIHSIGTSRFVWKQSTLVSTDEEIPGFVSTYDKSYADTVRLNKFAIVLNLLSVDIEFASAHLHYLYLL